MFLPGEFRRQRSLAGYHRPRGCKESDMTERLTLSVSFIPTGQGRCRSINLAALGLRCGCLECACFVGGTVRKLRPGSLPEPGCCDADSSKRYGREGSGDPFSKMKGPPLLSVSHLSLQSGPHSLLTSRQLLALAKASSVFRGATSSDSTPSAAVDAVITLLPDRRPLRASGHGPGWFPSPPPPLLLSSLT